MPGFYGADCTTIPSAALATDSAASLQVSAQGFKTFSIPHGNESASTFTIQSSKSVAVYLKMGDVPTRTDYDVKFIGKNLQIDPIALFKGQ